MAIKARGLIYPHICGRKGCSNLKKRKRCFTIMIVPHSEESTYSLRLPLWVGQMLAAVFVLGLTGIFILIYMYRNVAQEAKEARILRQVNQVQQEEINSFAFETQKLLEQMAQIEDLAGLVADKLGLDPDDLTGEDESGDGESEETEESSQTDTDEGARYYANRSGAGRVVDRAAANIEILQRLLPEQSDSLELLSSEVEESLRRWAATPSIWPAWGTLTSPFGMRRSPFNRNVMEFHDGIDIAAAHGSAIYATADGWVTSASYVEGGVIC